MNQQLFNIRLPSVQLKVTDNLELRISDNFDEKQMVKNVNEILAQQNFRYREGNPLSYHFNDGTLFVTGVADYINSDAPDIILL